MIPIIITKSERSCVKDMIVDKVPGPAMIGNAIGNIVAGIGSASVLDSIPNTIFTPK